MKNAKEIEFSVSGEYFAVSNHDSEVHLYSIKNMQIV